MTTIKSYSLVALFLLSSQAISGANPISWQLNHTFGDTVPVGLTSSITYTMTNQLPFPLAKPIMINKTASPQTEFSYVDNCSGLRLQSKQSCTVQVNLAPLVNGTKSLQLIIAGYDNNKVPLPQVMTEATGQTQSGVEGKTSQSLPSTLQAGKSASYSFLFTNQGKTTASNLSVSVTQTIGTADITYNNCTNSLNPGSSCTVSGVYTPNSTSPSTQTVSAQLTFSGASGSPAVASTSTTVTAPPGDIVGSLVSPKYLPPLMVQGTTYNVQFLFTNVTSHSVNLGSNAVTCIDSNDHDCSSQISFPASGNSCNIPSLPTTAACQISGTFIAPSATTPNPTTYNIQAQLNFTGTGTPATVVTSGAIVASLPTSRTITLINQCTFPVWFSLNGSAVSGQSCASGCPSGTSCNSSTGKCYWNNYAPNSGTYQLTASGGTTTVTIPSPTFSANGVQWSGNISASTLCNPSSPSGTCGQASCGNSNGSTACAAGIGFTQPATQAEITMNLNTDDSYDVEVINGFHIPISMIPMYYSGIPATANNYTCGAPGGYNGGTTVNGFGSCNWDNAVPPSTKNGYYWVTAGGSACNINTTSSQCPAGQLCGLDSSFNQTCGNFLGYWSADQVCSQSGLSSTVSNYFLCNQALPGSFPAGATLYSLMACSVPTGSTNPTYNSCYLSYPNYTPEQIQTCCGCVDWWNASETGGVVIGANSTTASCMSQTDPQWTQYVQPMIQWMKAACPSAYTYPFDDKTSGFSCTNNLAGQPNSTGYLITFCEGNTGLPTGITDGR